jgi:hypothetical protein
MLRLFEDKRVQMTTKSAIVNAGFVAPSKAIVDGFHCVLPILPRYTSGSQKLNVFCHFPQALKTDFLRDWENLL